jgi:hypothetical protein
MAALGTQQTIQAVINIQSASILTSQWKGGFKVLTLCQETVVAHLGPLLCVQSNAFTCHLIKAVAPPHLWARTSAVAATAVVNRIQFYQALNKPEFASMQCC